MCRRVQEVRHLAAPRVGVPSGAAVRKFLDKADKLLYRTQLLYLRAPRYAVKLPVFFKLSYATN